MKLKETSNFYFSKNLPAEIKDIIPEYEFLNVRSEADFYGVSRIIANKLGLKNVPRSFSGWSHGVHIGQILSKAQINWMDTWNLNYLVRNLQTQERMNDLGLKNVHAVGMPILYVDNQVPSRQKKSILFMPAHSLSYVRLNQNITSLAEVAVKYRSRGYEVFFCLHRDCVADENMLKVLEDYQLDWFTGASAFDVNSLQRMRNIFEYFEYVASNKIGSHFFYAQLFGAKFFFTGGYFETDISVYKNDPLWKNNLGLLEKVIALNSESGIRERYPDYFNADPELAVCDQEMARAECGFNSMKKPKKIAHLLGWKLSYQILCPLPYYSSKLIKKLKNKIN